MSTVDTILTKIYYSPDEGFISSDKLYRKAKTNYPNITRKNVDEFLKKQYTAQVNRQQKRPKQFNSIISPAPRNNYQIDIMIYDRYEFHGYKYILCVIDVYSRYAEARAMTNRNNTTIMHNLKDIFSSMGVPKNINCDNEFDTKEFEKYIKEKNITVYFSDPDEVNKNAIVERFNRTLASLLQKWRTATGKYDWYKVLPKFINNYNNSYHRTIDGIPADIFNLKDVNKQHLVILEPSFNIGDQVRIKRKKKIFDKGDLLTYSEQVYTIIAKVKNRYRLKDNSDGRQLVLLYKPYELIPANQIQYLEKTGNDEAEHKATRKAKIVKRTMRKEGINQSAIVRTLRERKPKNQVIDDEYGNIVY
jgi:hypothetical protein